MKRVLVIADDLTGAAEIAGIGRRYGLAGRLLRDEVAGMEVAGDGMAVIDTDSRSLSPGTAGERVRSWLRKAVSEVTAPDGGGHFDLVFKKTDSVLRGSVKAELEAMMEVLGVGSALLVPQNPSRGRVVVKGRYLMDGVPLDQTAFGEDPEYPARTADVVELVRRGEGGEVRSVEPGEPPAPVGLSRSPSPLPERMEMELGRGINVGSAGSMSEVQWWAKQVGRGMVAAGGADFFEAILGERGLTAVGQSAVAAVGARVLMVCGSASGRRDELVERARERGIGVHGMPDDVFRGTLPAGSLREPLGRLVEGWCVGIVGALDERGWAVVVVPQAVDRTAGAAERVQAGLAEVVECVVNRRAVDHLLLEGGATASAICRRMGWGKFEVEGELEAGVVQLRVMGGRQRLVVKPGSYAWPAAVWGG